MASYTPGVKEILRAHGCQFERRGKGDPEIWYGAITQRRFPVDGKIVSRHTANAVLRQAGIAKQF
ncbi:MAG: type II toxin-antitoxin system HicA family toxin [Bryobacteraceae bacterium]|jgi:hypothetical protein